MYYVSTETFKDNTTRRTRRGAARHVIVLRDSIDPAFKLQCKWWLMQDAMRERGIEPEEVVGMLFLGNYMHICPIHKEELPIFGMLKHPVVESRTAFEYENLHVYKNFGDYDFNWNNSAVPVSRLLLQVLDVEPNYVGFGFECSNSHVGVCICDSASQVLGKHEVEFLRYEISSWSALRRALTKLQFLCPACIDRDDSFVVRWDSFGSSDYAF